MTINTKCNMNQEDKDGLFMRISWDIGEMLCKKNHDYGDSAHQVYEDFGNIIIYIRLLDKINRLKTHVKGSTFKVADESVKDIYRDMAGYCILALASIERIEKLTTREVTT